MISRLPDRENAVCWTQFMKTKYRIVSDASDLWRRKESDRMEFLALPPQEAQRLISIGIDGSLKDFPAEPGAFGSGLTDEEDGLVE